MADRREQGSGSDAEDAPLLNEALDNIDDIRVVDATQGEGNIERESGEDDDVTVRLRRGSLQSGEQQQAEDENEVQLGNIDTIVHLLKGNIGTGILAMPDAIKNSGMIFGHVGLVMMSVICIHSMHLLVKCAHTLCHRTRLRKLTYSDVVEQAFLTSELEGARRFAKFGRITITVFLCITQLGFCCVYFVFVSQNIKMVMDHHSGKLDYHLYMLMVLPFMLALCSIMDLKYLSPISMIANVLQVAGLCLIFFYLLQDIPKTWTRKYIANWSQLPLYFGTAMYAFEGIGVVLPLENQMRNRRALRGWNGVLNTAMIIVSCLYIAVGFFGYLKYGDDVAASITLSLPVTEVLAQIIIFIFAIAIFLSYALQFYVPIELFLPYFQAKFPNRPILVHLLLRYSLVLVTFVFAAAIPRLDLFISLVGAASSSTLALMAPPIIETITFWPETAKRDWRMAKNIAIFSVGFIGFLTGSYVSIQNIISYFISGE